MITYWDKFGVLDKRNYVIFKGGDLPLKEDGYINHSFIKEHIMYDRLTIMF